MPKNSTMGPAAELSAIIVIGLLAILIFIGIPFYTIGHIAKNKCYKEHERFGWIAGATAPGYGLLPIGIYWAIEVQREEVCEKDV